MGVPKFFRWCAERYPNITRNLGNNAPPIDNLYLDVNGIIHNCTHPNDFDVLKQAPSEKEMIHAIFSYLERLLSAIQPRKHFMVAVDGVAPRAKMNQQRQRRYRAGYEMMVAREEAIKMGEDIPEETAVFDSNCITPGTPFMVLVSEKIQYFLAMKVSSDPSWQKCKIIYSGHDCPGEGEHKIVEFIRRRKMEPGYSPNETHCMYGLDADLIMLALTTHEPRFVLLREEVKFGNNMNKRKKDGGRGCNIDSWREDARLLTSQPFVLLDIGVLRDYLELEVNELCKSYNVPANHNLERFFDDFVFSCFFIGNDFLPSLPTASINEDVILELLKIYIQEVRSKNGYLTHQGKIIWEHTERWLNAFGKSEMDILRRRQKEEEQQQKYRSRTEGSHEAKSTLTKAFDNINDYKTHFYTEKHKFPGGYQPTGSELRELRRHYVEGLTWVMDYYYQGPTSWKWYFPHYYAPMASDLVGLAGLGQTVKFEDSQPFLPHQQLLAVLPPMSYRCLPRAYWPLLKSKQSPLASAFPEHIEIDREGARASWEGIVLIPFIDEALLLSAYASVQSQISEKEQEHNRLGPPLEIFLDMDARASFMDNMFPPLVDIPVCIRPFTLPPPCRFVPQLCPGYDPRQVVEGFGSLVTPHSLLVSYGRDSVKVFDLPSRRESLYINVHCHPSFAKIEDLQALIGLEVLVGYPYWCRAKLEMLENATQKVFRYHNTNKSVVNPLDSNSKENLVTNTKKHAALVLQRQGIQLENIPLIAYVCLFTGMEEDLNGVLRRHYSPSAVEYPVQLISPLSELNLLEDPRFKERRRLDGDSYSPYECCVMIRDGPSRNDSHQINFFGAAGRVLSMEESSRPSTTASDGAERKRMLYNIRVKLPQHVDVPMSILESNMACNWKTAHELAARLGLQTTTITTLCGSCPTSAVYGSHELGLPIKLDLQSLSRVGYAKLVHKISNAKKVTEHSRIAKEPPPEGHYLSPKFGPSASECRRQDGIWLLSAKAIKLLCEYIEAFPPVVKVLEASDGDIRQFDPMMFLIDEWENRNVDEVIEEIETFVKNSGLLDAPVMSSWEDIVPPEEMQDLEKILIEMEKRCQEAGGRNGTNSFTQPKPAGTSLKSIGGNLIKRVPAEHLFFPASRSEGGQIISFPVKLPNKRSPIYRLGSRVVNCCVTGCVPFGATGTIVRFFYARDAEVVYDSPFIGGSKLGGRLRTERGAVQRLQFLLPVNMDLKIPWNYLCNAVLADYSQRISKKYHDSAASASQGVPPATKANGTYDSLRSTPATAHTPSLERQGTSIRPLPLTAILGAPFYGHATTNEGTGTGSSDNSSFTPPAAAASSATQVNPKAHLEHLFSSMNTSMGDGNAGNRTAANASRYVLDCLNKISTTTPSPPTIKQRNAALSPPLIQNGRSTLASLDGSAPTDVGKHMLIINKLGKIASNVESSTQKSANDAPSVVSNGKIVIPSGGSSREQNMGTSIPAPGIEKHLPNSEVPSSLFSSPSEEGLDGTASCWAKPNYFTLMLKTAMENRRQQLDTIP